MIILRKMKSNPLGVVYDDSLFSPIKCFDETCMLSVTANLHSSQYQNIMRKYGVKAETARQLDYLCWKHRKASVKQDSFEKNGKQYHCRKQGVYEIADKMRIVGITPTYDTDKPKYSDYAKKIVERCRWIGRLHFTHFGFLKTAFPRSLIIKILNEFLAVYDRQEMKSLKICWDIDEKFADEMAQLLAEKYSEFNMPDDVVIMSEEKFTWEV